MATRSCPRCGAELPDPVGVCTQCGKFLNRSRPVQPGETREKSCLGLVAGGVILPVASYVSWRFLDAFV